VERKAKAVLAFLGLQEVRPLTTGSLAREIELISARQSQHESLTGEQKVSRSMQKTVNIRINGPMCIFRRAFNILTRRHLQSNATPLKGATDGDIALAMRI
jgi:hypothetical protein